MAWTVPSGCYYAFPYYTSTNPYIITWAYYDSGQTVTTEQSPNYASQPNADTNPFILIDFTNGYIYTHLKGVTIDVNANNTFTATFNYDKIQSAPVRVLASHNSLANENIDVTLTGEVFSFGNGTGLFDKDDLLSGREYQPYVMSYAFYNRTDITSVTLPDDVDSFNNAFEGCSNLTAVTGTACIGVRQGKIIGSAEAMFKDCSSLITPPIFDVSDTSANVNFNSCFYGCTSLVNAPALITNIKNMDDCFNGCTSLTQATTVPISVTSMRRCFSGCVSLAGAVTINAASASTTNMFYGTVNEIVLFGNSPQLGTIASSYANVYVWSLSLTMAAERNETTLTTIDVTVDVSRFKTGNLTSLVLSKNSVQQAVTWSDPTLAITGTPTTFTTSLTGIAENDAVMISVIATDSYGSSTEVFVNVPIAFYTIDIQAGGKEVSFGGLASDDVTNFNGKDYSSEGLFKCNMGTAFNDMTAQDVSDFVDGLNFSGTTVVDYVIEQGTSGGWSYTKWNSGKMVATKDVATGSSWTTVVSPISHNQTTITPPTGMTVESGYAILLSSSAYIVSAQIQISGGTTTYLEVFRLATSSASFNIRVTLIGSSI